MKSLYIFLISVLIFWACSTPKGVVEVGKTEQNADIDSVEYDLKTFDSKFDIWYLQHNSPALYRSLEYYENWNRQYVQAWNINATQSGRGTFFEPIVGYDPREHYGIEINHKLFYYFQYVENVLHIQIMPNGPNVVGN